MSEDKVEGKLVTELLGLGKSLGKLTARRAREWADEAREEVLATVRDVRQDVDRELGDEDEQLDP